MLREMGVAELVISQADFQTNLASKPRLWRQCVSSCMSRRNALQLTQLDGLLSFATISLALKVPRISDPKTQQLAVIVWGGVIFVMYSFLLSVFRIKNGGYPFWLPPFS
jgi:hypothetical protein